MTDILHKQRLSFRSVLIYLSVLFFLFQACKTPPSGRGTSSYPVYTGGFTDYGALVFSYKDTVPGDKFSKDVEIGKQFFQRQIDSFNLRHKTKFRIGFIVDTLRIEGRNGMPGKTYYRIRAVHEPMKPFPPKPFSDSTTTPDRPCGPRPGSKFEDISGVDFGEVYYFCAGDYSQ